MISTSSLDIGGLNPTVPATYSLRLYANPNVVSYTSAYGAYSSNPNMINDIFRQYLGREPSISEAQAWAQTISNMHPSEKDVMADILAIPAFYDRAGNDEVLFIEQMIESNTRSPATYEQIQYWSARLGFYGGNRLLLTREYVYSF
ncbi:MAG: hypothetical protein FJ308_14360 [Planctomycetes bacterium]|nr:hypothetical protein [Planctomycetota bacterium]